MKRTLIILILTISLSSYSQSLNKISYSTIASMGACTFTLPERSVVELEGTVLNITNSIFSNRYVLLGKYGDISYMVDKKQTICEVKIFLNQIEIYNNNQSLIYKF
jgi:hypothetical protein